MFFVKFVLFLLGFSEVDGVVHRCLRVLGEITLVATADLFFCVPVLFQFFLLPNFFLVLVYIFFELFVD